jgi:hypothetical protein
MEFGVACNKRFLSDQIAASLCNSVVEFLDRFEVFVRKRLVNKRPEMFSRLEFGGIGWLVDEPDPVRNRQVFRSVPAGIVELEHDDAIAPSAGFARECFKQLGEKRLVEAVRQIPDCLAPCRRHKSSDVEPLVAVMAERNRPLGDRCPYPTLDRS